MKYEKHLTPYGQWLVALEKRGSRTDFLEWRKSQAAIKIANRSDGFIRGLTGDKWTPDNLRSLLPDDYSLIDGDVRRSAKEAQADYSKRREMWEKAQLKKAIGAAMDVAKAMLNWYPSAGVYITYDPSGLCRPFGVELRHYGTSKRDKASTDYDPMLATV